MPTRDLTAAQESRRVDSDPEPKSEMHCRRQREMEAAPTLSNSATALERAG